MARTKKNESRLGRMIAEHDQLREKTVKIINFLLSDEFFKLSQIEKSYLRKQANAMTEYLFILKKRIDLAKNEDNAQDASNSLVGMTIVAPTACDTCPYEQTNCKKLILADGSQICCVKK